ncbi:MAG: hydrolase, partial [Parascardovia denticolens]
SESPTIPARLHVVESGSPAKKSGNEPAKELDSLDALRAAASAAWHALDSGLDPTDFRLPAFAAKLH